MGEELGRVYNALTNEVSRLHVKYDLWRQLYGRSLQRVDFLNRTAGHFFGVLQGALIEEVLLQLPATFSSPILIVPNAWSPALAAMVAVLPLLIRAISCNFGNAPVSQFFPSKKSPSPPVHVMIVCV
jgi:hypothetical protein